MKLNNKKRKITVIVLITLIVLISGASTYAFFYVPLSQNINNESVTTGELSLNFVDGPQINVTSLDPGSTMTKTVSVTNDGTYDVYYLIGWSSLTNEFLNDELVIYYSCTSYKNYGRANEEVSGTCNDLLSTPIATDAEEPIDFGISIKTGITHVYNITIEFIETSSNQNYNQGKTFSGVLEIKESTGPDIRLSSVKVDGVKSSFPTSGSYYLTKYKCDNEDADLSWDKDTNKLSIENYDLGTTCAVELKSNPLLSEVAKIGDYVAYTGSNGCQNYTEVSGNGTSSDYTLEARSANACTGQNANQASDTSNFTYGYCYSSNYKFYTKGWRVAYKLDSDNDGANESYIVSAGSPECVLSTESDSTATITSLNNAAINYCNANYAYGGGCQSTYDVNGNYYNTWSMNGIDFYNITNQLFNEGRRLSSYGSTQTPATETSSGATCRYICSTKACGYNNDLIDNGGWYWFASGNSASDILSWDPAIRYVYSYSHAIAFGARPVVHLKSSIYVTGGSGTMDSPYEIGYE